MVAGARVDAGGVARQVRGGAGGWLPAAGGLGHRLGLPEQIVPAVHESGRDQHRRLRRFGGSEKPVVVGHEHSLAGKADATLTPRAYAASVLTVAMLGPVELRRDGEPLAV